MSKILYLSCHSILEFDEVSLFHQLGHEVFSPGAYVEPANPGDPTMRPAIPGLVYNPDIVNSWHQDISGKHPSEDGKDHLTKEFVDKFDIVIVMHLPRWIHNNWEAIKHKRVIWRTIGQSITSVEEGLKKYRDEGMEIVRYSPMETTIPGFIGQDAMIRFYKDPDIYKGWTGHNKRVITFAQSMRQRGPACNFPIFEQATKSLPRHLFGPGNEGLDWSTGKVTFERQLSELKENRVYFYTGTHPASYTLNFMEAWMTGIPIVAIGPKHGNANYFHNHNLYEIPNLIVNGYNGYYSDDPAQLRRLIGDLLTNDELAEAISVNGRQSAIHHFGKDMIREAWRNYLRK